MDNFFVKISNVATLVEAEQMISFLKANSILAEKRETGSGSYLNIISNLSLGGYDIYVVNKDQEKAKALIDGQQGEKENENQDVSGVSKRKIAIRIYAIFALALVLITFIMIFLNL